MTFIEAKESKIGHILSNQKEVYKVPIYQRPYAWNKDHWEDLYEDILNLEEGDTHFLGSIVLVPERDGPRIGSINYFQIVDGQQRLTTILIWLSVIRDMAKEKGEKGLADYITKHFLFSNDYINGEETYVPKMQLGESDLEYFLNVIEGKEKKDEHKIYDCYNYFYNSLTSENCWKLLTDNISLVHINAFNHFNAFRLFETLNDRGLELSAADLIKNFILMRVSNNKEVFDETISQWNEMYDKVRQFEPVTFIRRYMLSNYRGKVSKNKLYDEIKKKIGNKNDADILEFVKDLNYNASIYKKINETSFINKKINRLLLDLQLVEVSPSYTLLLTIFSLFDSDTGETDNVKVNNTIEILKLIESFHIRWGISQSYTSRLDQIYNNICMGLKELYEDDKTTMSSLEFIREVLTKEIKDNADNSTFESKFISRQFNPNSKRTKYILWKLSEPSGEMIFDVNNVQTEHIMPQNPRKEWFDYLKRNSAKTEEEIKVLHKENLNLIGNLTLIKGEWNQSMSNKLFESKKKDYEKSDFTLNEELLNLSQWKFREIEKRSIDLAERAINLWNWDMSFGGKFDTKFYWILFLGKTVTDKAINDNILKNKTFAFRGDDKGRNNIKPGDLACFYVYDKGVVAHSEIKTYAQKLNVPDFESPLWICELKNPVVYVNEPIVIDKDVRQQLDAFKDAKNLNNWGWFITKNHTITENDFKLLTKN